MIQLLVCSSKESHCKLRSGSILVAAPHAADVLMGFDSIAKVDPTNSHLLEAMWELMSHNMAVVNFWLSFCLFPNQTGQYPQRLSCNAWHLADTAERQVYGFSGTNDNHRLLPLQVQQADMSHKPLLAATNGKMLDVMLHTSSYATLAQENEQQVCCCQAAATYHLCLGQPHCYHHQHVLVLEIYLCQHYWTGSIAGRIEYTPCSTAQPKP